MRSFKDAIEVSAQEIPNDFLTPEQSDILYDKITSAREFFEFASTYRFPFERTDLSSALPPVQNIADHNNLDSLVMIDPNVNDADAVAAAVAAAATANSSSTQDSDPNGSSAPNSNNQVDAAAVNAAAINAAAVVNAASAGCVADQNKVSHYSDLAKKIAEASKAAADDVTGDNFEKETLTMVLTKSLDKFNEIHPVAIYTIKNILEYKLKIYSNTKRQVYKFTFAQFLLFNNFASNLFKRENSKVIRTKDNNRESLRIHCRMHSSRSTLKRHKNYKPETEPTVAPELQNHDNRPLPEHLTMDQSDPSGASAAAAAAAAAAVSSASGADVKIEDKPKMESESKNEEDEEEGEGEEDTHDGRKRPRTSRPFIGVCDKYYQFSFDFKEKVVYITVERDHNHSYQSTIKRKSNDFLNNLALELIKENNLTSVSLVNKAVLVALRLITAEIDGYVLESDKFVQRRNRNLIDSIFKRGKRID